MRWISVRNWRKFQHYDPAKRQPRWIKVYTDLLDRPEYRALAGRHRGLLHDIWMLYARTRCELPASASYIAQACGYPTEWEARQWRVGGESVVSEWRVSGEGPGESVVRGRDIERLCKAGFIEFVASPTLAEGYFRASLEVEVEKEPVSKEKHHSLETAAAAAVEDAPNPFTPTSSGSAQQLVGEFVDACRETGIEAPRRTIGQVAQETGKLVSEGIEPDAIRAGYRRMVQRGLVQPSLLANFVAEASIPNGVRARASGQGLTPAQILEMTRENP